MLRKLVSGLAAAGLAAALSGGAIAAHAADDVTPKLWTCGGRHKGYPPGSQEKREVFSDKFR
jgi:hypothetical protein